MQYRTGPRTPAQHRRRVRRIARRAERRRREAVLSPSAAAMVVAAVAKTRWTFAAMRARRKAARESLDRFLAAYWANLEALKSRYVARCPYQRIYQNEKKKMVIAEPCGGRLKRSTKPDTFECRICGRDWSRRQLVGQLA